jgi:endonuclease III
MAQQKSAQARKTVTTRRIRAVYERLRKAYGPFVPKDVREPLDELIVTVLSQHTSDVNSSRAFAGLKARFSSWQEVVSAETDELADSIRQGGIAQVKAGRIKQILEEIEEREGRLSLGRLHEMDDEEVDEYLCSLPGVGPKTSACVMVFSMGRAAFPVDTHVERVVKRLGWVSPKASAVSVQRQLTPLIAPDIRYELHMQLIRHGREICKPRMPLCSECAVFDFCEAGPKLLGDGAAR